MMKSKSVKTKQKTCKACRQKFTPTRFAQSVCNYDCSIKLMKIKRERERKKQEILQRKNDKTRLEELKTKPQLTKDAHKFFNRFIRLRDKDEVCISCGRSNKEVEIGTKTGGFWDCGHYLSVGSHPEIRFCEKNAYKQCKTCNGGSGKYTGKNYTVANAYRERLINRIGEDEVNWLEGPHEIPHYTHQDLREIKLLYKQKCKYLLKSQP